jgi:sugar/nucleoside kinase (ribokinase family)
MSTGVAPITVDAAGENCIVVVPGANSCLSAGSVTASLAALPALQALLVQLEVPLEATVAALSHCAAMQPAAAPSFFTPAPAPAAGLPASVWPLCSVIIPNAGEACALAGLQRSSFPSDALAAAAAGEELLRLGARSVAVTLGAAGVLLLQQQQQQHGGASEPCSSLLIAAPRVAAPVDTTGAGDAFSGSLAFFYMQLSRQQSWLQQAPVPVPVPAAAAPAPAAGQAAQVHWHILVEAARRAVFVAACSVTRKGTQSSYFKRAELPPALFDFASGKPAELPAHI